MKNLLYFLLGGLTFISVAAGTTEILTVKPATPKYTAVVSYDYGEDVERGVKLYLKSGYIVKSITSTDHDRWIVVMEKY